ncbi:actin cortical patch SUR7/pH-response regulator pali [Fomitopsis betulina]|nr:actin cortical patch SUR7/pH-response regulator pali [Fomitopsis betulina]
MQLRGEVCIGSATILSLTALLCLIFMHVGQINTSSVPRHIAMIRVNMSGYGEGLYAALSDPIHGLYTANASAPLQQQAGLRNFYDWGLYGYCAYVNTTAGTCSNMTAANRFQPYNVITSDMLGNYSSFTDYIITSSTFIDSTYLGNFTNGAYYLLLLGTICAAMALICGLLKHPFAFLVSTAFTIIGSAMLLIGATIWTVIIKKAESINGFMVGNASDPTPLGITVSMGNAVYLAWAAFVTLLASILPYMISCCTYRG